MVIKLKQNYSIAIYLGKKISFKISSWWQGIKLLTAEDLKKFLNINQKISFISWGQIRKKHQKRQLKFLAFQWSDDLNKFQKYQNEIIMLNFLDWQQLVKVFNKKDSYLILGPWHNQMEYYRYLKFHGYKVYLYR